MCGRFVQPNTLEELVDEFEVDEVALDELLGPSFNVAPTQEAPIICFHEKRRLRSAIWGLQPDWAGEKSRPLINARSETVREKPSFSHLVGPGRCVVPASGFYEFDSSVPRVKVPHYIYPRYRQPIAFAGLVEEVGSTCRFTILTTAANQEVSRIHDRMPVILELSEVGLWLSPFLGPETFAELIKPRENGYLAMHAVSGRVNSPANNDAGLLDTQPTQGSLF